MRMRALSPTYYEGAYYALDDVIPDVTKQHAEILHKSGKAVPIDDTTPAPAETSDDGAHKAKSMEAGHGDYRTADLGTGKKTSKK